MRLVAVQYAGEVFPHNNVSSRYTLLIGAGDVKDDVARNSQTALYAGVKKANSHDGQLKRKKEVALGPILPDFMEMLGMVLDKSGIRVKSSFKVVVGDTVLPFSVAVGAQISDYLRLCLWNSAGVLPSKDLLEEPITEAPKVRKYVSQLINENKKEQILRFIELVEKFLKASAGLNQALALLHLIGAGPVEIAKMFVKKMEWFKFLLNNTREDFRETIASIYGLVSAVLTDQEFDKAISDLTRSMKEKQLEFQHGAILSMGYSFGRRLMLAKLNVTGASVANNDMFVKNTKMIVTSLDNSHNLILSAACQAIAELGRSGPLPLSDTDNAEDPDTKLYVVTKLLGMVKSGKTSMKVRERAAMAAGSLCLGDNNFPHRR